MLLGTLGANLLVNLLLRKGIIRGSEEKTTAVQDRFILSVISK